MADRCSNCGMPADEHARGRLSQMKAKADRWDALLMVAHRMGIGIQEVLAAVERRIASRKEPR